MVLSRIFNKLRNFFVENKLAGVLFILSTVFYIYQHYSYLSWDFSAYVLNSRYLFSDGTYFESQRPPLTALIMGTFIFLGEGAEYLYIIMVSSLFLYASMRSADSFFKLMNLNLDRKFARFIFYFFSLSIFSLLLGLKEGTELLTLALLEIFLVQLVKGKISGAYLGLAFLARYQMLMFFPLMIFSGDFKRILKNVFIFILIIFPWFLWNFISYGNWFTSFVDGYVQNIALREAGFMPFDFNDVVKVGGIYLITAFFGIVILLQRTLKERNLAFIASANFKNHVLEASRFSFRKSQSFAKRFIQSSLQRIWLIKLYFSPNSLSGEFGQTTIQSPKFSISRMGKISRDWWKENKAFILILIVSFIIIYSYYVVPFKFARYLFNLTLPIAFFSSVFVLSLGYKLKYYKRYFYFILFFSFLVVIFIAFSWAYYERNAMDKFFDAAQDIKRFELGDCEILSPHWVPVTYFTGNVYPVENSKISDILDKENSGNYSTFRPEFSNGQFEKTGNTIAQIVHKKVILIFNEETLDNSFTDAEINSLPVFYRNDEYTFYARKDIDDDCSKKYVYNRTYVNEHCKFISGIFSRAKLDRAIQKICEKINLRS